MEYRVWSMGGKIQNTDSRHTRYAIRDTSSHARHTPYAIRHTSSRGFSLMELVVVMGIIVIVSSVTLANNARFGGVVLLQNLAYDMALSIRQAQVYGISVRQFGAEQFDHGYGMHFSTSESGGSTHYTLFADLAGTGVYDPTFVPSENVSAPYVIGRGYFIAGLCAPATLTDSTDPLSCTSVSRLDIVFKRPEPDANITGGDGSGQSCIQNTDQCKESARIIVKSPRGDTKSILVEAPGQISVQ